MKKLIISILFWGISHFVWANFDSLGIEVVDGRKFILHKLEPKETLFSLAKRYHASVDEILSSNSEIDNGLKIDQIGRLIRIPYNETHYAKANRNLPAKTHKVKPSETLYSISRAYNVTVDDLKKWNKLKKNDISIGQELIVENPKAATSIAAQQPVKEEPKKEESTLVSTPKSEQSGAFIWHQVEAGQGLYAIARLYEVSVASIKEWNELNSEDLVLGQRLKIYSNNASAALQETKDESALPQKQVVAEEKKAAEEVIAIEKKQADVTIEPAKKDADREETKPAYLPIQLPEKDTKKIFSDNPRAGGAEIKKTVQKGIAEVIEGSANLEKDLALHRTAKVGTIMLIKNDLNGQMVFVRVLGKLPDTGVDDKVVVRISKKAFEKLGGIDSKFPVEISWVPLD